MDYSSPMISCLCVTRSRVSLLRNSIANFIAQSYKNKELVIIYVSSDLETADFSKTIKVENVRFVVVPDGENLKLGEIRNISIENARGEYICIWDDDDWFHQDRLTRQMAAIKGSGKGAAVLTSLLLYDRNTRSAFTTNIRPWENSLLCDKTLIQRLGISYPPLNRGEDTPFVTQLIKAGAIQPVIQPQLYLYYYTGANTCGHEHFSKIFSHATKLPDDVAILMSKAIAHEIAVEDASLLLDQIEFDEVSKFKNFLKSKNLEGNFALLESGL